MLNNIKDSFWHYVMHLMLLFIITFHRICIEQFLKWAWSIWNRTKHTLTLLLSTTECHNNRHEFGALKNNVAFSVI